jgi:hypothetical protein
MLIKVTAPPREMSIGIPRPKFPVRRWSQSWAVPDPERICTSIVERSNLSIRMGTRRFTRVTNAFSRKWESHWAAVSLWFGFFLPGPQIHTHDARDGGGNCGPDLERAGPAGDRVGPFLLRLSGLNRDRLVLVSSEKIKGCWRWAPRSPKRLSLHGVYYTSAPYCWYRGMRPKRKIGE